MSAPPPCPVVTEAPEAVYRRFVDTRGDATVDVEDRDAPGWEARMHDLDRCLAVTTEQRNAHSQRVRVSRAGTWPAIFCRTAAGRAALTE